MSDTPLILPYDVEGEIVGVVERRHEEHLAKLERQRGLAPRTFEKFKTVARMSDSRGLRLSGDTTPALLLGVIGAPEFERNENDSLDAVVQLGMQVTAFGNNRRDTILRRDVYAWTVIELIYQRLRRDRTSLINSVRLTDYEPMAEVETQRVLADARLVWEIGIKDVLSITGFLPAEGRDVPPEAGGPPVEPYDPPEDRPIATFGGIDLDRQPLVE